MKTPTARITVNGKEISTRLVGQSGALVSMTVTDEAGIKADTLTLEIDNTKGFPAPPIDAEIKAWLGYEPEPVYMGSFKVDQWTKRGSPKILSVNAKAADFTSDIKSTKTRSHHATTVGAIVRKIAAEHGLTAQVDARIGARVIAHIDQQTESNLGFLSRLAKRNGATFKLADGKIIFAAKGSKKLPSGANKTAVVITPDMVSDDWSVAEGQRGAHKSVKCAWVDHATGRRHYETAGSGKPCHRDKHLYASEAEAKAAAQSKLGDLTRGVRTADFEGPGNPALFAEALVTLKGFDPDADGDFLVKTVSHSFSSSGFRTSVTLETEGGSEPEAGDTSGSDSGLA